MEARFYEIKRESRNFGILPLFIIGIILVLLGEYLSFQITELLYLISENEIFRGLEAELFSFAGISLMVILWARFVEKSSLEGLGIRRENIFKEFFRGWIIGTSMLILSVIIMILLGVCRIIGFNFSWTYLLKFFILILAWTVQASTEEILARGWLFSSLAARKSMPVAIIFSSLFFALLHLGNDGIAPRPMVDLILFGVLTALYMLKQDSIWGVCGIHASWNCFQGNVFSFPVSGSPRSEAFIMVETRGPEYLSGGIFGVEGSLVSIIIQVIIIGWLIYKIYPRKRESH